MFLSSFTRQSLHVTEAAFSRVQQNVFQSDSDHTVKSVIRGTVMSRCLASLCCTTLKTLRLTDPPVKKKKC